MEFLPVRTSSGQKVYAGFWKRACAAVVDVWVTLPFYFVLAWLEGFGKMQAMAVAIPYTVLFAAYSIYFNKRFGGTLGKLAVGIRITKPDGSMIGWLEAWKRSAVDLAFAVLCLILNIWAMVGVDVNQWVTSSWLERQALLHAERPGWYAWVNILFQIWVWSELIVLLLNKRKRALHDFIAGTVVIHKKHMNGVNVAPAESTNGPMTAPGLPTGG
jgi:uncharacterized RDD family membrane protein YckC